MADNFLHSETTDLILKAFYKVYNTLGYGFLEKVYENALLIELKKMGLNATKQVPIKVYYKDEMVGDYYADIIVEDQLINYLKATNIEVGLLLNFGKKPQFSRKIFTNKETQK